METKLKCAKSAISDCYLNIEWGKINYISDIWNQFKYKKKSRRKEDKQS